MLRLESVGDRDVTEDELVAIVNALPLLRVSWTRIAFTSAKGLLV